MTNETNTNLSRAEEFKRTKSKEEMQRQLISFGLMIVLTVVAFAIVATDAVDRVYVLPILFVLAIVQAGFQFYYFMHLKDKGHAMPATLIYGGVWAAFLTLAGLIVISWW
ncbi:MAG TPA: cytochrome c oxidase subunit IVB [Pseudogracilibacillus sp.]|nr:cytochrome c oxidase subunit IVB [Pseudogracilibacillus sp.]